MPETIRIVYAGTPDFAVPSLSALIRSDYEVVAVYTQPDRPAGRGRESRSSPVCQKATEYEIPVYKPESLKSIEEQRCLSGLEADIMVVAAYGLLLPKAVLEIPRLGCINVHASLLPRWRGAAPIQRAILAGDEKTGITIMQMDEGLDTGDMLARNKCVIKSDDTASSLHDRLMVLGADTLTGMLPDFIRGVIQPEKQDESCACYASKLSKQEAEINWSLPAEQLARCVRAYNDWPVAFTHWKRKGKTEVLRVWKSEVLTGEENVKPIGKVTRGTVVNAGANGIDVVTGDGILRLLEIQTPGKRVMSAADFVNAHQPEGQVLGNVG
jgi:methionyl-tRNA formyltransferase